MVPVLEAPVAVPVIVRLVAPAPPAAVVVESEPDPPASSGLVVDRDQRRE